MNMGIGRCPHQELNMFLNGVIYTEKKKVFIR